jgi:hypothetical protein
MTAENIYFNIVHLLKAKKPGQISTGKNYISAFIRVYREDDRKVLAFEYSDDKFDLLYRTFNHPESSDTDEEQQGILREFLEAAKKDLGPESEFFKEIEEAVSTRLEFLA